jgi:hypothetical protein
MLNAEASDTFENIFPRGTSDGPSEDVMLKDRGEKEFRLIDRLGRRDKSKRVNSRFLLCYIDA